MIDIKRNFACPAVAGLFERRHRQVNLTVPIRAPKPRMSASHSLDNLRREAVAAIADLGHHRWLRLKSLNGKPAHDVTRPAMA
jgi:hypothetical protein